MWRGEGQGEGGVRWGEGQGRVQREYRERVWRESVEVGCGGVVWRWGGT